MGLVKEYMLRIVAAGLICGAATRLLAGKGAAAVVGKMLTGLFLAIVILSPLADLDLGSWETEWGDLQADAQAAVTAGKENSTAALRRVIKERTEAYILDKAQSLAVQIAVEVTLSDDPVPVPVAVRLSGNISPYAKQQLQTIIAQDLGIPKEAQQWT